MKQKIAINLWVLRNKQYDGIGYFAIQTTQRMIKSMPETEFILLLPANYSEHFFYTSNVFHYKIFPPLRHPILYVIWIEIILPIFILFKKIDKLYSPDGMICPMTKADQFPVIHDLNFILFPQGLKFLNRVFYNIYIKKYCQRAKTIFTVSEFSKKEIIKHYKVYDNKIKVIYNAVNFLGNEPIKNKVTSGEKYFLFIGSIIPRKNLKRLLYAFELFKERSQTDIKLKLAGNLLWDTPEIKNIIEVSKFKKDIEILGRITDEVKFKLMQDALALCFVSIYEGFGVPILEAFYAKTILITSNTSSMPEIAGDAAFYVDPFNEKSIALGLEHVSKITSEERNKYIEKGKIRLNCYSWDKSSKEIENVLSEI